MISIDIDGNPIPWKRVGQRNLGSYVISYDRQKPEKEKIRLGIAKNYKDKPLTCALKVDIHFFLPIPKSTTKKIRLEMQEGKIKSIKKPDIDNLSKFILDCMTGFVYADDSQIVELTAKKLYSSNPGTLIQIIPIETSSSQDLIQVEEFCSIYEECKNEKD